ncbi:aromatase [Actinacidiphila yanglinensis]|uniref:Aromatase n=1 Tax=Actinacidiphila yanglinensis TaxID=310779 RepID=A0A1H6DQD9_9ACTN|nr:aromatase/cyclase [Actinacidiphila yanglinensis]SEG87461.1 aromatase [Actinacidiphila yanglinensis]
MPQRGTHETEHTITVAAPATAVYQLLADVGNWPRIFAPTLYVDHLERSGQQERIRVWATANGEPKSWTSHRTLDPRALRIDFRQEVSAPPVARMAGTWIVEPRGEDAAEVRLLHDYRAVDDSPEGLEWIDRAVDRNSRTELEGLRANVERAHRDAELTFTFEDVVHIDGSVRDVYDFVNDAGQWEHRLPHVARVRLTEDTPGLQTLEMDTRAQDGSTHTTKSHRVCLPPHRIAYKQVTLPALLSLHTGLWTFTETTETTGTGEGSAGRTGVAASSRHTVVLDRDAISGVLGPEADVAAARDYVRTALSANSRATLDLGRAYAESGR